MSPGSNQKIQALAARASTAERRLKATQDQLQAVETKFEEAKNKVATAEDHWQARLRELMNKLKEAEEKNKRERQGAKERVRELQQNIRFVERMLPNATALTRLICRFLAVIYKRRLIAPIRAIANLHSKYHSVVASFRLSG